MSLNSAIGYITLALQFTFQFLFAYPYLSAYSKGNSYPCKIQNLAFYAVRSYTFYLWTFWFYKEQQNIPASVMCLLNFIEMFLLCFFFITIRKILSDRYSILWILGSVSMVVLLYFVGDFACSLSVYPHLVGGLLAMTDGVYFIWILLDSWKEKRREGVLLYIGMGVAGLSGCVYCVVEQFWELFLDMIVAAIMLVFRRIIPEQKERAPQNHNHSQNQTQIQERQNVPPSFDNSTQITDLNNPVFPNWKDSPKSPDSPEKSIIPSPDPERRLPSMHKSSQQLLTQSFNESQSKDVEEEQKDLSKYQFTISIEDNQSKEDDRGESAQSNQNPNYSQMHTKYKAKKQAVRQLEEEKRFPFPINPPTPQWKHQAKSRNKPLDDCSLFFKNSGFNHENNKYEFTDGTILVTNNTQNPNNPQNHQSQMIQSDFRESKNKIDAKDEDEVEYEKRVPQKFNFEESIEGNSELYNYHNSYDSYTSSSNSEDIPQHTTSDDVMDVV